MAGARAQLGPYTVDWIGPVVTHALELFHGVAHVCTPGLRTEMLEDARLLDRLLHETSRPHVEGLVLGGRTGLSLIAALERLLTAARAELAAYEEPEIEAASLVAELDAGLDALARATETLAAELDEGP